MNTVQPAHLFIGNNQVLAAYVESFLQQLLCGSGGCGTCVSCQQIQQHQHAQLLWIYPEKQYTLDLLAPLLSIIGFVRGPAEPCYIVLQNVDFLTPSCANVLLKPLEEPIEGYHFILLAARERMVLPTIRSRCITKIIIEEVSAHRHKDLFNHFAHIHQLKPTPFLRALDQAEISEKESIELIDDLIAHWHKKMRTALTDADKECYEKAQWMLQTFHTALQHPPMPGSSKLFWKNLYLQI